MDRNKITIKVTKTKARLTLKLKEREVIKIRTIINNHNSNNNKHTMPKVIPSSNKVITVKHSKAEILVGDEVAAVDVDTGAVISMSGVGEVSIAEEVGTTTAGEEGEEMRDRTEGEGEEEINAGIAIEDLSGEVENVADPVNAGIGRVGIGVATEENAEIGMNLVVSEADVSLALQKKKRAETEGAIETILLTKDVGGVGIGEIVGTAVATLEGTAAGITENQKSAGVLRGEVEVGEEAEVEAEAGEEAEVEVEMEGAEAEEGEKENNKRTNKKSLSILLRRPPVTAESKKLEKKHPKSPPRLRRRRSTSAQ